MINHFYNQKAFSENYIVITFDDGLRSIHTKGYPVILQERIPIIVYLVSDFLQNSQDNKFDENRRFLNLKEIMEMNRSGLVEYGSHTVSHACLSDKTDDVVERELKDSKEHLEGLLGQKIKDFAFMLWQFFDV